MEVSYYIIMTGSRESMKIQLQRHELRYLFENESGIYGVVYGFLQICSMYVKEIYYHDELQDKMHQNYFI